MIQCFEAPNWKDEAAYPITKDAKPTRWAWEFLRRNKGYQTDWQTFADAVMAKAREHPETLKYAEWFLTRNDGTWAEFAAHSTPQCTRRDTGHGALAAIQHDLQVEGQQGP